jgi:hypothetical protein
MSEQRPSSGNRWEPADPTQPTADPTQPTADPTQPTADPTQPTAGPAADDHRGGRRARLRRALARPGTQAWVASFVAALVVVAGAGGFVLGRASVDRHDVPTQVGRDWDHDGSPFGDEPGGGADESGRQPAPTSARAAVVPTLPPDERPDEAA